MSDARRGKECEAGVCRRCPGRKPAKLRRAFPIQSFEFLFEYSIFIEIFFKTSFDTRVRRCDEQKTQLHIPCMVQHQVLYWWEKKIGDGQPPRPPLGPHHNSGTNNRTTSAAQPPMVSDAATPGLPSIFDSGFKNLFTDTPGSVQSGLQDSSCGPHRKVQTELLLDDIRAALNEKIDGASSLSHQQRYCELRLHSFLFHMFASRTR